MEDIKEKVKEIPKMITDEKLSKNKRFLYLFPIALLLLGLLLFSFFWSKEETRDSMISFVDSILLSNETHLNQTDNIDDELLDLPEDFLETSEVIEEEVVDIALEELDRELENISNLESDFTLDASDVGL